VNAVAVTPEGQVVSGSDDRTIKIWDPYIGKPFDIFGNESHVLCIALSQDHHWFVCGDSEGHVWIFEWIK
jgi:WD40 repeat protein